MRLSRWVLVAAFVLAGVQPALAQACKPLTVQAARLNVEALRLFNAQGEPKGRIAKTDLAESFIVTDCNDPTYVMMQVKGTPYLVRKNELTMPRIDTGCVCRASTLGPRDLGTPGAGDIRYCPAAQCPGG
ncbi:hypothetical protein BH10PSE5_BH10PSE5_27430 [soil metagenome]